MSSGNGGSAAAQPIGAPEPVAPPEPITSVTGVARSALGTATNLDDTQVFRLDELHAAPVANPAVRPVAHPVDLQVAHPVARPVAPSPQGHRPERAAVRPQAVGRRAGPILAAGLAIAVVAALLALQGAGSPGLGELGGGAGATSDQGAAATPLATIAPAPTNEPKAGGGNGNGNGRGNGGGGKPR